MDDDPYKIDCLYYADIRTHKIYEEIREIEKHGQHIRKYQIVVKEEQI